MQLRNLLGKQVRFRMGDVRTGQDTIRKGILTQLDNTNPLGMDVVRIYTADRGWVTTLASTVIEEVKP